MKNTSSLSLALLMSSLVFLPGCAPLNWVKDTLGLKKSGASVEANDGSEVLASIDGKALLTAKQFEKQYNNFIEKHPLGALLKQTEGFDKQVFNGLVSQKLISKYVQDNKLDESAEYQDDLAQLKAMLDARYFEMKNQVKLSDADIKKFYDEKKDAIPAAVVSRGGVAAVGIEFDKEADAKAFLAKAKAADVTKAAKEAKLDAKVRDLKLVNEQTVGIEPALKEKIVAIAKFPTTELFPVGNKFWVVTATSKKTGEYRPFDQVKDAVREMATMEKQRESFEKAVDQLKKEYGVKSNEEYFAKKKAAQASAPAAEEQFGQVMPEASKAA